MHHRIVYVYMKSEAWGGTIEINLYGNSIMGSSKAKHGHVLIANLHFSVLMNLGKKNLIQRYTCDLTLIIFIENLKKLKQNDKVNCSW